MNELDITRRALAEIGTRTTIASMNDGSPEANYASLLYVPLVGFLLREGDYDWSIGSVPAVPVTPIIPPWNFTYAYPAPAIRIRQLIPAGAAADDPRPVTWNVLPLSPNNIICTKLAISTIVMTQLVDEDHWDTIFQEALVRLLGSALAFALENRIEASQAKLNEALNFAGIANLRDA